MKCPVCGFLGDPSKDLCARCFIDLREHKKSLGLPVIDPNSSYDHLLAQKVRIVEAGQKSSAKASKLSLLKSVFKRRSDDEVIIDAADFVYEEELDPSASAALVVPESSQSEQVSDDASGAESAPRKLKLSKRQRQQLLGLLRKRSQESESDRLSEKEAQELGASAKVHQRLSFSTQQIEQEQAEEWQNAYQQIGNLALAQVSSSSAIELSSLVTADAQASLSVYFALAREELISPESRRDFTSELGARKVDVIESQFLKEAVGRYEVDSDEYEARLNEPATPVVEAVVGEPASLQRRFYSWLIDCALLVILSLGAGTVAFASKSDKIADFFLGTARPSFADLYSILLFALLHYCFFFFVAMPALRRYWRTTLGERLTKLRVVPVLPEGISFAQSFGWTSLSLFSFLSFGLLERRGEGFCWREKTLGLQVLRTT